MMKTILQQRSPAKTKSLDRQLITIEIWRDPNLVGDFNYPHPNFTIGDLVVLRQEVDLLLNNWVSLKDNLTLFQIRAIELVEETSCSGQLTEQPYFRYGIRSKFGSKQLIWCDEDQLISYQQALTLDEF